MNKYEFNIRTRNGQRVDKITIQALDRKDPVLPLSPGRAERHGFEYFRHGTLSLYAAFNTKTGEVLGKTATRHTSAEFVAFLGTVAGNGGALRRIPVIGYAQAGVKGFFDEAGFPTGAGWDELLFPELGDLHAYALEISGDAMIPVYRDGDTVVVSPEANLRRGDRVVLRTNAGEVMAKQLARKGNKKIVLLSLNDAHPDHVFAVEDVAFVHRIVWVSQ